MGPGEISAISTGAVAIVAIAAAELRHRASLGHARELADLESVRGLLDEVAVAMHGIEFLLNEIRVQLIEHGAGFFEANEGAAVYDEFTQAGIRLDELLERLKIRLGPAHEAADKLREASGACVAIHHSLKLIKLEDHPPSGAEAATREVQAFFSEQRQTIAKERKRFDVARVDFIESAQRTAGADLPT